MGLLGRIFGLGKGKADRAIANAEANDPDAVFRNAIQGAREKAKKMNDLQRQMHAQAYMVQERIQGAQEQLADLESSLQDALNTENEQLGGQIITRIDTLKTQIEQDQAEYEALEAEANEATKVAGEQEARIHELEQKRVSATSTLQAAAILKEIEEYKKGLSTDAPNEALRTVEQKVAEARATKKAALKGQENSFESQMASLKKQSSESTAKNRFQEMLNRKKVQ